MKFFNRLCLNICLILILTSCEEMFTTNIFASLDILDLSALSTEEQASEILSDPEAALEGLSDSEIDEILSDLTDLANDSSASDETQMQAAAAVSEIELEQSGADTTIDNLSDIVSDPGGISEPEDILFDLFVDESGNPLSVSAIEIQLEAMLQSMAALEAYGSVLGTGSPPAGVNTDEQGFTALVVGMIGRMSNGGVNSNLDIATAISTNNSSSPYFNLLPSFTEMTDDGGMTTEFGADLANVINGSSLVTSILDTF